MTQLQQIRQEIERHRGAIRVLNEHTTPEQTSKTCAVFQYADSILSELNSFLDTLEQQEKDVDLEKEIDKWNGIYRDDEGNARDIDDGGIVYDWRTDDAQLMVTNAYIAFARHFYELGKNAK